MKTMSLFEVSELLDKIISENLAKYNIGIFYITDDDLITEADIVKSKDTSNVTGVKMGISVYGDGRTYRGFENDPYFKIFSGSEFTSSPKDERTRISIYRPEQISHEHDKWNLSGKEKKALVKILQSKLKNSEKTVWEEVLNKCVEYCDQNFPEKMTDEIRQKIYSAEMPNYNKLNTLK